MAPHKMALFPNFLPATASATEAPRTICVSESNISLYQSLEPLSSVIWLFFFS